MKGTQVLETISEGNKGVRLVSLYEDMAREALILESCAHTRQLRVGTLPSFHVLFNTTRSLY